MEKINWIQIDINTVTSVNIEGISHVLDFKLSHKQLLIRGELEENGKILNIDLIFKGVKYLQMPTVFINSLIICRANEEENQDIKSKLPEDIAENLGVIFKLISKEYFWYIGASYLFVSKNSLDSMQSSIL